jgi:outer membrane lipoprotein
MVADAVDVTFEEARGGAGVGRRVRWGGTIEATRPGKDETCLEVVQHPLDAQARPRDTDESLGRFLACAPGFYDPAVYSRGRAVTVVGMIREPLTDRIGEYDYHYARVAAADIYLWPKREPLPEVYYLPPPWPYYYGPYYPSYFPPGWYW